MTVSVATPPVRFGIFAQVSLPGNVPSEITGAPLQLLRPAHRSLPRGGTDPTGQIAGYKKPVISCVSDTAAGSALTAGTATSVLSARGDGSACDRVTPTLIYPVMQGTLQTVAGIETSRAGTSSISAEASNPTRPRHARPPPCSSRLPASGL